MIRTRRTALATNPLHANRLAVRNALAIPLRTKTCRLVQGRSDESQSTDRNQSEGEHNAHHVSAGRIPVRPSHVLIRGGKSETFSLLAFLPRYGSSRCIPMPTRTSSAAKSGSKRSPQSHRLGCFSGRTVNPLMICGAVAAASSLGSFGASRGGSRLVMHPIYYGAF